MTTKKAATSNEKGSSSRSTSRKASTTTSARKTSEKGVKTPQKASRRGRRPKQPTTTHIEVKDTSRRTPQEVGIRILYNPERELKYEMMANDDKANWQLLKRLWKFYRQVKRDRKLQNRLNKNRATILEAVNPMNSRKGVK